MQLEENDCDFLIRQYATFIDNIPLLSTECFSKFNENSQSVDFFFLEKTLSDDCSKLFEVMKTVLVLSYGQAAVERI